MDPATLAAAGKAGLSLYEAGGLALLLLGIIVIGATLMARFLIGMIRELGARLNSVQDDQTKNLTGVIKENTAASRDLREEMAKQTATISAQTEALRGRPCLIESGVMKRPPGLPA